jgi:hypothetical protein
VADLYQMTTWYINCVVVGYQLASRPLSHKDLALPLPVLLVGPEVGMGIVLRIAAAFVNSVYCLSLSQLQSAVK